MAITMLSWLEVAVGVLIWCGVLWDGFATIILPRTVAPMRRLSGRFYRSSWWLWAAVGRRIRQSRLRLVFLSVYGPLSVMLLLNLWAGLIIVAFALIFQGLGPRFLSAPETLSFGRLLYMSGSIFLTLGLGDVTSPDSIAWLFILLEAGSGYIFLALVITYMPVLEQAYSAREVGNLLIHSRAGHPPSAIKLLRRYASTDRTDILRGNSARGRALDGRKPPEPSLPSRALVLPCAALGSILADLLDDGTRYLCALDRGRRRIARGAGEDHLPHGSPLAQRLDRTLSVSRSIRRSRVRLQHSRLARLARGHEASDLPLRLGPNDVTQLVRLVRRYDVYLVALSACLVIPLPLWIQPRRPRRRQMPRRRRELGQNRPISATMPQVGLTNPADGPVDTPLEKQSHDPRSD